MYNSPSYGYASDVDLQGMLQCVGDFVCDFVFTWAVARCPCRVAKGTGSSAPFTHKLMSRRAHRPYVMPCVHACRVCYSSEGLLA